MWPERGQSSALPGLENQGMLCEALVMAGLEGRADLPVVRGPSLEVTCVPSSSCPLVGHRHAAGEAGKGFPWATREPLPGRAPGREGTWGAKLFVPHTGKRELPNLSGRVPGSPREAPVSFQWDFSVSQRHHFCNSPPAVPVTEVCAHSMCPLRVIWVCFRLGT